MKAEDRNHRTRCNQHADRIVHFRANPRDPNFIQEDLHQVSEPCPARIVQDPEERHVRLQK